MLTLFACKVSGMHDEDERLAAGVKDIDMWDIEIKSGGCCGHVDGNQRG